MLCQSWFRFCQWSWNGLKQLLRIDWICIRIEKSQQMCPRHRHQNVPHQRRPPGRLLPLWPVSWCQCNISFKQSWLSRMFSRQERLGAAVSTVPSLSTGYATGTAPKIAAALVGPPPRTKNLPEAPVTDAIATALPIQGSIAGGGESQVLIL